MPDMDGMGGVRADLDSGKSVDLLCSRHLLTVGLPIGSALTYLPGPVIRAMQRTWFNLPPNALGQPIYLTEPDAWKKCDIVFKFMGNVKDALQ